LNTGYAATTANGGPFAIRAIPVLGPDGAVAEWVGVHTDVTEQRAAEEALREETRALETLNRAGASLAAELDLERIVQTVTDAGVELTGASFGAFFYNVLNEAGESFMLYTLSGAARSAFDGFGMPRATAIFQPTFKGEGVIRSDDILADPRYGRNAPHRGMPEGHLPVRSYLAVPVASRSGEAIGGLFFGHPEPARFADRHERLMIGLAAQAAIAIDNARLFQQVQRAKETLASEVAERTAELEESRRRFRGIFDSALQFMALLTPDGTVAEVNETALQWSQIDAADIVGKPFWLAAPMRENPALQEAIRSGIRRAAAGQVVREEHEMRGSGDVRAVVDFSLKPVRGSRGDAMWLVAEGRDITELKRAQDALRQAQKMEAVGQLTGGIAHDFNNLLGAVVGSFDLIRRKPNDVDRVRRFAEAGLQAAERGAKLTGQLLAFSRAQRIEMKPLVVTDLVSGMHDMLSRTLGPMVRLKFDLDGDGAVLSDPTQLEMAVLNLAINARDAMAEGGDLTLATAVRVVRRDPELRPGEYVELTVQDTGSGMPPEVAARAFDPFFTTKGVGKGTGLGLSQVYGIAKQAGGTVRIESRPGAGTVVRILLPRTDVPVHANPGADTYDAGTAEFAATILVVDDDPDIRRVLADSLDALGYRVIETSDGESGLAALETGAPDLMMVDFAMPGMNGAEVAKAVRARMPQIPIVFASGYADTAAIESVAGRDAIVLRKPFRIDELQAAIVDALSHRS
jgi:PAS domain S-box-containing protein